MEIKCNHNDDEDNLAERKCNDAYCKLGDITPEDEQIIQTGFNIFIFFSYMNDMFPDLPKLKMFRNLEEGTDDFDDNDDDDDDDEDLTEEQKE